MYRDASHLWRSFSHNRTKINIQFLNDAVFHDLSLASKNTVNTKLYKTTANFRIHETRPTYKEKSPCIHFLIKVLLTTVDLKSQIMTACWILWLLMVILENVLLRCVNQNFNDTGIRDPHIKISIRQMTLTSDNMTQYPFSLRFRLNFNIHLRNECLFFWVHGEWIVARDKQIAWTAKRFSTDLFVPRYDSFPMNTEKKTLVPYIYNASNQGPFIKFSEKNYKFKFPTVTGS